MTEQQNNRNSIWKTLLPAGIDEYEFEERAAIMEYDGNMPREEAERLAYEDITKEL